MLVNNITSAFVHKGVPVANGTLEVYTDGTTNQLDNLFFLDGLPAPNPVRLNSNGGIGHPVKTERGSAYCAVKDAKGAALFGYCLSEGINFDSIIFPNDGGIIEINTAKGRDYFYSKSRVDILINGKQDKLTAGENITIEDNVISATDTIYDDAELRAELAEESLKRGREDSLLQNQIDAFQGALIYIGTIGLAVGDVTQDALNGRASELGKVPLQTGYVLVDDNANDWWFDGGEWVNIGYYDVAQATNYSLGVVSGSAENMKVSVDGAGEMSVNGLEAALDDIKELIKQVVIADQSGGTCTLNADSIVILIVRSDSGNPFKIISNGFKFLMINSYSASPVYYQILDGPYPPNTIFSMQPNSMRMFIGSFESYYFATSPQYLETYGFSGNFNSQSSFDLGKKKINFLNFTSGISSGKTINLESGTVVMVYNGTNFDSTLDVTGTNALSYLIRSGEFAIFGRANDTVSLLFSSMAKLPDTVLGKNPKTAIALNATEDFSKLQGMYKLVDNALVDLRLIKFSSDDVGRCYTFSCGNDVIQGSHIYAYIGTDPNYDSSLFKLVCLGGITLQIVSVNSYGDAIFSIAGLTYMKRIDINGYLIKLYSGEN
jgi:hypothetical protein